MDYNITLFFVSRTWDWPQEVGSAQAHSRTDIKKECDVGYKTQSSLVRNSKCSGLEIKKECCSLYVSPWSKYFVTQIQMLCATYRAQKLLVCYGK